MKAAHVPALLIVACCAPLLAQGNPNLTEETLGELHDFVLCPVASDDGRRLAYVTSTAPRFALNAASDATDVYYGLPPHHVRFRRREGRLEYGVKQRGPHPVAVTHGRGSTWLRGLGLPVLTLKDAAGSTVHGAEQGSALTVVVDGEPGLEYDWIGPVEFSPSGGHFTYRARRGEDLYVVIDGSEIGPYDPYSTIGPPRFSADGRHVAYVAYQRSDDGAGWQVVVDGEAYPQYYKSMTEWVRGDAGDSLVWSADGERLACIAAYNRSEWFVVVDSVEGKSHPEIDPNSLTFSPDGSRFAYRAQMPWKEYFVDGPGGAPVKRTSRGGWMAVIDGVEGPEFYWLGSLTFSPDSRQVAYAAGPARGPGHVYLDGERLDGTDAPKVGSIVFSADGRRLAYVRTDPGRSQADSRACLVVDGIAGAEYRWIWGESVTFSPDSRHVAFVAGESKKRFVVVDGEQGPEYDHIDPAGLCFTPDSEHVLYAARRGDKWVVVVDEQPGPELDALGEGSPVVSPVGGRYAYAGKMGGGWIVVIDGETPLAYDQVPPDSLHFSPDGRSVAFLAQGDGEWSAVIDGVKGPAYDAVVANGPAWVTATRPGAPMSVEYLAVRDAVLYRVRQRTGEG